jgi:hypothetical protein
VIWSIRRTRPHWHTGLRSLRLPLRVAVGLGLLVAAAACDDADQAQSFAKGFTSAREEGAARSHPDYARRLRQAAQLAASVKTDSLRKLYLAALDAPAGRVDTVWNAISCEYVQQIWSVGGPTARRVQLHLDDSLLALPGVADRWRAMNRRLSGYGTLAGCIFPSAPPVPDSVEYLPMPNVLP